VLAGSDIHFDVNSAALTEASLPLLEQIAAIAAACPPLVLRIEGHTDDTGVAALNQSLSERRAVAVADRLAELGVDPARLRAVGLGASDPAAGNATEAGRRENRRIEIIVER
jgi:outer membrane protein OmpA-like peptidoglycan-associated protein